MKRLSRRRSRATDTGSGLATLRLPAGAGTGSGGSRDADAGVGPDGEITGMPQPVGFRVRSSVGKARRGWYAPQATAALTTTRQAEVLNPALLAPATGHDGILIGEDCLSNSLVAHDPFTAYEAGVLNSPNVVVIGSIGYGKSSLLKTCYVLRPLVLRGRRVVVIDKKDRAGEGEYAQLTRTYGHEPLRFVLDGGGTRLNLLDPVILAGSGVSGQFRLLRAIAELASDGAVLDKWETQALRWAHQEVLGQFEGRRTPVLADLLPLLGRIGPACEGFSAPAVERIHQAGLGVRFLFAGLLSDELGGLFDGDTSPQVQLSQRLTTFDVSQLPDDSPAVSMVVTTANVWLLGMLRNDRGKRTYFCAEEGWHLVEGPGGRVFKSNSKLARGLGLANVAALHHPGDIPPDSPAVAMLKEAETVHLFRQSREEDITATVRLFNLQPGSRGLLEDLPTGQHLLKIGAHPEIHVRHVRSGLERDLTNTDEAMTVSGQR